MVKGVLAAHVFLHLLAWITVSLSTLKTQDRLSGIWFVYSVQLLLQKFKLKEKQSSKDKTSGNLEELKLVRERF